MTDQLKNELMQTFKEFDANGDGKLDPSELATMMKSVGISEQEAAVMAENLDEDGDGNVDFDEFKVAQGLSSKKADNKEDQKEVFAKFDRDGDGQVTAAELLAVCDFLDSDGAKEIMQQADADNDGKIGFDEWLSAMSKAPKPTSARAL